MRWSERVELSFRTFRRCWLPLYGWYLIFMAATFMAFLLICLILMADAGFRVLMDVFLYEEFYGDPFYLLENFLPMVILFFVVYLVIEGAFMAGTYNLSRKAYFSEKAQFKDFKFTGTLRAIGWMAVVMLLGILSLISGLIFIFITNSSLAFLFRAVYWLLLVALWIFLAPWATTSGYYMLTQPQMSFSKAFSTSFSFFYRHMKKLWGYIGLTLIFLVALAILDYSFPNLSRIAEFLYVPLGAVISAAWVLSILEEEKGSGEEAQGYETVNTPEYQECL